MEPKAIVYSSNTGHTEEYARLLSEKSGLPCYTFQQSKTALSGNDSVVYMGWLMAGFIKDYKKALKRYQINAVCAVGLGKTGSQTDTVRKNNKLPEDVRLYTLQGGIDHGKLTGLYRSMIQTLIKVLSGKKSPTEDEAAMLALLQKDDNYVSSENLNQILSDYNWL